MRLVGLAPGNMASNKNTDTQSFVRMKFIWRIGDVAWTTRGDIQKLQAGYEPRDRTSVEPNFHQVACVGLKFAPLDALDDIGQRSVRGRPDADLLALACYQAVD